MTKKERLDLAEKFAAAASEVIHGQVEIWEVDPEKASFHLPIWGTDQYVSMDLTRDEIREALSSDQ
jgi:hypothetical protein